MRLEVETGNFDKMIEDRSKRPLDLPLILAKSRPLWKAEGLTEEEAAEKYLDEGQYRRWRHGIDRA